MLLQGPGTFGFSKRDLGQFFTTFQINSDIDLLSQVGFPGKEGGDNWGECTLDMSYIAGMGNGVKTISCNTNDSDTTEEVPCAVLACV